MAASPKAGLDDSIADMPLPPMSPSSKGGSPKKSDPMSDLMKGMGPIKKCVDDINASAQKIPGLVGNPAAAQICGQIVALASSVLAMAAQSMVMPAMAHSMSGSVPGTAPSGAAGAGPLPAMPPPPGPPPPVGQ